MRIISKILLVILLLIGMQSGCNAIFPLNHFTRIQLGLSFPESKIAIPMKPAVNNEKCIDDIQNQMNDFFDDGMGSQPMEFLIFHYGCEQLNETNVNLLISKIQRPKSPKKFRGQQIYLNQSLADNLISYTSNQLCRNIRTYNYNADLNDYFKDLMKTDYNDLCADHNPDEPVNIFNSIKYRLLSKETLEQIYDESYNEVILPLMKSSFRDQISSKGTRLYKRSLHPSSRHGPSSSHISFPPHRPSSPHISFPPHRPSSPHTSNPYPITHTIATKTLQKFFVHTVSKADNAIRDDFNKLLLAIKKQHQQQTLRKSKRSLVKRLQ